MRRPASVAAVRSPSIDSIDPIRLTLALGPLVVFLAWWAAGQWEWASREHRAWLQLAGVVGAASLVPLPGLRPSIDQLVSRMTWLGWTALAGLVATT